MEKAVYSIEPRQKYSLKVQKMKRFDMSEYERQILRMLSRIKISTARTLVRYAALDGGKIKNAAKMLKKLYERGYIARYEVKRDHTFLMLYTLSADGMKEVGNEPPKKYPDILRAISVAKTVQCAVSFAEKYNMPQQSVSISRRIGHFNAPAHVVIKRDTNRCGITIIPVCLYKQTQDLAVKVLRYHEQMKNQKNELLILLCSSMEDIENTYMALRMYGEVRICNLLFLRDDISEKDDITKKICSCQYESGNVTVTNMTLNM